jgi:hypothetical protein
MKDWSGSLVAATKRRRISFALPRKKCCLSCKLRETIVPRTRREETHGMFLGFVENGRISKDDEDNDD